MRRILFALLAVVACACASARPTVQAPTAMPDCEDARYAVQLLFIDERLIAQAAAYNLWNANKSPGATGPEIAERCKHEIQGFADLAGQVRQLDTPASCVSIRDKYLHSLSDQERSFKLIIDYAETGEERFRAQAREVLDAATNLRLEALGEAHDLVLGPPVAPTPQHQAGAPSMPQYALLNVYVPIAAALSI